MEVVYAVDAQKGNPMLRSMPNGLVDKGQSRAHLDDGIKPSSVWKSETEISIADFLTASKGVFGRGKDRVVGNFKRLADVIVC